MSSNVNVIGDTVQPTSYCLPLAQRHTVLSHWGEAAQNSLLCYRTQKWESRWHDGIWWPALQHLLIMYSSTFSFLYIHRKYAYTLCTQWVWHLRARGKSHHLCLSFAIRGERQNHVLPPLEGRSDNRYVIIFQMRQFFVPCTVAALVFNRKWTYNVPAMDILCTIEAIIT